MKNREAQLAELGLSKVPDPEMRLACTPLIRAMAAMLAEATKPQPKRERNPRGADWVRGKRVYDRLREMAPTVLVYEPAHPGSFANLGKVLIAAEIEDDDIDLLAKWLREGGLRWMNERATWGQCCRFIVDWVGRAKAGVTADTRSIATAPRKQS